MPESLLAAQRDAIERAMWPIVAEVDASSPLSSENLDRACEMLADAVLDLVGAWLVGAVQAERERAVADVLAACDAMWGEGWGTGTRDRLERAIRDA